MIFLCKNAVNNLIIMIVGVVSASFILYKNIDKITMYDSDSLKIDVFKKIIKFSIAIFLFSILSVFFIKKNLFGFNSLNGELFVSIFISVIILWFGNIAPKIPYNKQIGLRLPWTITNEKAWIVAHRVLGYISFPLAIIYISYGLSGIHNVDQFKLITLFIIGSWILIPAIISLYCYCCRNDK